MGIKKCKDGAYRVWYSKRHPITRVPVTRRRKNIKSKALAKRIEAELILMVEHKLRATVVPTWEVLLSAYPTFMREKGLTEKTIDNYLTCLRAHTLEAWGLRLVDSITTEEIRTLLRVKGKSSSQQQHLLKFIRSVLKYALEKGYINRNPVPEIRFRNRNKIKKVLTEPQASLLLEKAKEYDVEWYPHWCMALYTGMRTGELYALTWDQVDLEQRQILVNRAWNNKDGFKETKSGEDRMVEIAQPLLPVLKELRLLGEHGPFVLPRLRKWDKGEQARELRLFLLGLGLPVVRFHDLRATWATMLLGRGTPSIMVMKMGGWKDIKTMQIYARKSGVDIRGMTDCLNLHDPTAPRSAKVIQMTGAGEI